MLEDNLVSLALTPIALSSIYFRIELWMPLDAIQHLSFDGIALFDLVDHDGPSVNLSNLCLNIKSLVSLKISFIYIY